MRRSFLTALACWLFAGGCQRTSNESFTPAKDQSRNALVAVMDQWKAGAALAPIDGQPAIHIADTHRREGQKLLDYEIIGELPLDVGLRYQVKLKFDNPAAEEKVQYVVVGKDPLWVFRQEDYDMLTHWDHPMPEAGAGATTSAGSR